MADFVLHPHADFSSTAIRSITASATREAGGRLDLEFHLVGAIDDVAWPQWKGVGFADGLWEHSCVEAFVGDSRPGYLELNFATSGKWAAYRFDGYRAGMRPLSGVLLAGGRTFGDGQIRLRRSLRLPGLADMEVWRLGLSAIIETKDGAKSYWALAHPPGKPDFHHEICLAAQLAAPDAS